jgi:hypothetical protein
VRGKKASRLKIYKMEAANFKAVGGALTSTGEAKIVPRKRPKQ